MTWLTFLRLVLQIAARLAAAARNKRLMDAGEARAIARSLVEQQGRVARALRIRRAVSRSQREFPDKLREPDRHRRD